MPRPLSMHLRERLVEAVNTGLSCNAVAKRFAVTPSSVIKLMQAYWETGSFAPKKMGGHRKAILAPHEETVKALVAATPEATLTELLVALRKKRIKVSRSALAAFLACLHLTFKKTVHTSEQDRPDVAEAHKALAADHSAMDSAKLVFIHEIGVTTNMMRRYGRAPAGQRLIDKTQHGHWKITTCIAFLAVAGFMATGTFDGAMNGGLFSAWVVKVLVPTLKARDIVIWYTLQCHKSKVALAAIQATGATIRPLPVYRPDFNPIEKAFAKLKAMLRKAKPRTKIAIDRSIAKIFKAFTPEECRAYFKSCGYSN